MTTINIEIPKGSGNFFSVDEGFKDLPKSQQQKIARDLLYSNSEEAELRAEKDRQEDIQRRQANYDAEQSTLGEKISGTARGLGQGLLLGFGDEAEAGLRTGFGLLGDYGKTVSDIRQDIDDFRVSDPSLAYGSEIGGAVLPALASGVFTGGTGTAGVLGATATRLASPVAKGIQAVSKGVDKLPGASALASKTPNLYQGMKTGAGYGAVYGTGTAESDPNANAYQIAKDRLTGMAQGGTIGAVVGGATQPVLNKTLQGLSGLKENISRTMGNKNALERQANQEILKTATKDVGTSETGFQTPKNTALMLGIGQRMDSRAVNNPVGGLGQAMPDYKVGSPTVIADAGENLQSLGYATQQIANPSRRGVTDTLVARNNEQSARIMDAIKQSTNVTDDTMGISYINKIDDFVKEISDPAYKLAYSKSIPAKEFKEFFENDTIRNDLIKASREAYTSFGRNRKPLPPDLKKLFDENNPSYFGGFDDIMKQDLSTEFLHAIKKGLDKMVKKETKTVDRFTEKLTQEGVDLNTLRKQFNEVIMKNNPQYKLANKNFSDQQKLKEAFRKGEKYKTTPIGRIKEQIKNFNKDELDAWKIGMVSKLDDVASGQNKNRDFLNEVDGSDKLDEIFDILLKDNPVQQQAFKSLLQSEKAMRETYKKMRLNSDTASKSEAIASFKNEGKSVTDADSFYGLFRNVAREGIKRGRDALSGGTLSKRAELIAERLFTTSRPEQQKVLKTLMETNEALAKEVEKRLKTANSLLPTTVFPATNQGE